MKVGIVGMGWVGASVAISTLHAGIAEELLLHDAKESLAEGEAMDLGHGAPFYATARVRAAALDDLATADAVVIAAGRSTRPGQSRLDVVNANAAIVGEIARHLGSRPGLIVVVTNP